MEKSDQPQWQSIFGYVMVAVGSAIGLGNIWRFPYLAYRGGDRFRVGYNKIF